MMNWNSGRATRSAGVDAPPSVDVLVVDDDPSSLRTLTDMLEKAGYRVRSTGDPETGLNAALTEPPRLIVLDTRMPGMDGFELCRRLQADPKTSTIPIIFAADHHAHEDRARCFAEGGTEFICRPYLEAEVLGRIKVLLRLRAIPEAVGMLQSSEEHFRTLIEQIPLAIEVHSQDGKFLLSNPAYSRISGLHGAELQAVKETYDLRRDEQYHSLGFGPLLERLYAGEGIEFPVHAYSVGEEAGGLRIEVANADSLWVRTVGFPLKNSAGRTEAVVLMTADITEQRHAEEKLEHLRAYTDHLIETANILIVSLDTQGRVTHFNPAAETITGYTLAEVKGKDWFELLAPRERYPEVHESFERLAKGGIPQVLENPIVTKAGEERHVSWRNSEVTRSGAIVGVTSFGIDITERKMVEEALKASEEKLRLILVQSPLSIQILNPAGYLDEVNQAWMDMWGVKEEELEALKASYCFLEDEQLKELGLMPLVERAFRGERVDLPDIEYDAVPAFDGAGLPTGAAQKRWLRAHLYAVLDGRGEVISVVDVEEDITEAKTAELKLANYQERLRALGRDLTVSEEGERRRIASELHDNAAQSLALARLELVKAAKVVTDPGAVRQLDQVSQLLRDSLQQIRELVLDLSSPALREIGLAAAILEWSENHLRRSPGLQFSFNENCRVLEIDEIDAAMLFRNTRELLSNVVKHAGAGSLEVRLDCTPDEFLITVTDDGCGFSPAEVAQRPTSEGGFGIFSIRERMADLGGALDLDSAPGRGCTAVLRMPQDRLKGKD